MLNAGYPAIRFSVAVENYNHQHQDLRVENGVEYGDTIDKMDFEYLTRVVKLNVAALAALARTPAVPEPTVEGAVSTDTTLTWQPVPGAPPPTSSAGGRRRAQLGRQRPSTRKRHRPCAAEHPSRRLRVRRLVRFGRRTREPGCLGCAGRRVSGPTRRRLQAQ
jgi:hypothetical protein